MADFDSVAGEVVIKIFIVAEFCFTDVKLLKLL